MEKRQLSRISKSERASSIRENDGVREERRIERKKENNKIARWDRTDRQRLTNK